MWVWIEFCFLLVSSLFLFICLIKIQHIIYHVHNFGPVLGPGPVRIFAEWAVPIKVLGLILLKHRALVCMYTLCLFIYLCIIIVGPNLDLPSLTRSARGISVSKFKFIRYGPVRSDLSSLTQPARLPRSPRFIPMVWKIPICVYSQTAVMIWPPGPSSPPHSIIVPAELITIWIHQWSNINIDFFEQWRTIVVFHKLKCRQLFGWNFQERYHRDYSFTSSIKHKATAGA